MVKCEKSPIPPESLAIEKQKGRNGKYNKPDVVEQLAKDFSNKCYICELKDISDPQVEHLVPHHNGRDIDAMFDWNNLFFSCPHCNGLKNKQEYEGKIIDCCKDDPEVHLHCLYDKGNVSIHNKDEDEKSVLTAKLVDEAFNASNSGIRIYASQHRMDKLQHEISLFFDTLSKYQKLPSEGLRNRLRLLLSRKSAFASFKRDYIRDNLEKYENLLVFLQ